MQGCLTFFIILVVIALIVEYWPLALLLLMIYIIYRCYKQSQQKKIHSYEFQNKCVNYDNLDGHEFEYFCADVLRNNGYYNVSVTQGSGDYGADIIAHKNNQKYVIQCKCYSSNVGNKAIQEVYSAKAVYKTNVAVVMTNRFFTEAAMKTTQKTDVILWNRNVLYKMIVTAIGTQHPSTKGKQNNENNPNNEDNLTTHCSDSAKSESAKSFPQKTASVSLRFKEQEVISMYDKEKGVFPPGNYLVGEDIPTGTYILESKENLNGGVSIYESYANYKKDEMISYNSFKGDYHLSLRENGLFIEIQNADIRKI